MLSKKQTKQSQDILNSLYIHKSLSRADLARLLKITPATITEITSHLIAKGIVVEGDEDLTDSGVGRKRILLEVVPEYAFFVGVELSETKLVCCLTDNIGNVVATKAVNQNSSFSFPLSEDDTIKIIKEFLAEYSAYTVCAIGIAIPGHYDKKHKSIISNRSYWSSFRIDVIEEKFSIPVFVKNNVKCMALAKLYLNSEEKILNFVFIHLKRGMFAAYMHQGAIYGDDNYLVGEIGHSIMNPHGEQCECGQAGCLQTYASLAWIIKKAKTAYETGRTQFLNHLVQSSEELGLEQIMQAYHLGEELIQQIIEQAIVYLVQQINNMMMLVDAEVIYIHGKLFEEEVIADKLRVKLAASNYIVKFDREVKKVVLPYNADFGAIGAASLAIQQHLIFQKD